MMSTASSTIPEDEDLPPMTETELLLAQASTMRKLALGMADQHLILLMTGDGSPLHNMVRDAVGEHRRIIENAADRFQALAYAPRRRSAGQSFWPFVLRMGLSLALGITIAPFALMGVFWAINRIAPQHAEAPSINQPTSSLRTPPPADGGSTDGRR